MMVEHGDRLRAGIDIAGLSDFRTSLEQERPSALDYWRVEYGDERDPDTRALFAVDLTAGAERIKKPLLVIHCRNDQRVKIGEADQIVSAVERTGSLAWYVQLDGEGHSIERREHATYVMQVQVVFLKTFLLGR